ncbi:MAG TPA: antibiotic biosynthesis monooxygenase [Stellaceae bacterium]|nr:antibiotic biosynthesis monooxygenase [Stellaceae bacterium]
MFAVIFEVLPKPECRDEYLRQAGLLRPELEAIDGFITNQRYTSLGRAGWVLSLSLWRNEKAVIRWRTAARHHQTQEKGRSGIFADYHLRVGEITADTGLPAGEALRQERFDETETGAARLAIITEAGLPGLTDEAAIARLVAPRAGRDPGLVAADVFRLIARRDDLLLLTLWAQAAQGEAWLEGRGGDGARHRRMRVIRDYGMFDRREAPQYYPPVAG